MAKCSALNVTSISYHLPVRIRECQEREGGKCVRERRWEELLLNSVLDTAGHCVHELAAAVVACTRPSQKNSHADQGGAHKDPHLVEKLLVTGIRRVRLFQRLFLVNCPCMVDGLTPNHIHTCRLH